MSAPTDGERRFAARLGLEAETVAGARDALNEIALFPWPEPERVSLLARLGRAVHADVGEVIAGAALRASPLASFDDLVHLALLGDKRVAGLVRAIGKLDVASLALESAGVRELRAKLQALQAENAALRTELDRAKADQSSPTQARPAVIRLDELTSSIADQTTAVIAALQNGAHGLRLSGVELRVEGAAAATMDDALALDLAAPAGGSALHLRFASGAAAAPLADVEVPNVVGYAPALAHRKLAAAGFEVRASTVADSTGLVAEQSPAGGEHVPSGSLVRLLIR